MKEAPSLNYHTFEISIISAGTANQYQLLAQSTQGEANATTVIDPASPSLVGWLKKLDRQILYEEGLKAFGAELYQYLFVGKIHSLFNRALGETLARSDLGLRLRLKFEVPALNILPWELLYSPDQQRFLAISAETPLCRYISLGAPIRELTCPDQLRMLAVIPQSSGLNIEPEKKVLRELESKLASKIKVDFLEVPATGDGIRAALRNQDYHILHYAGHGLFQHDQAFLILDYSAQSRDFLTAEQFAHFFQDYHSMRLVVLNACQGATRSSHQALVGIAPQLVSKGVPAVIAMQDSIRDTDAILFATEFYAELCHDRHSGQVELAVSRARNALLQSPSQVNAFALPVLFLRAPDGKLWDNKPSEEIVVPIQTPASMPATETLSLHSGIKQLLPYTAEDADLFLKLQRRSDLEECFRMITDSEFRLGILLGESGCGKTSFLQAGLIPMLTKHCPSLRPIYVKFSNQDPITTIQQALSRDLKRPIPLLNPQNFRNELTQITTAPQQTLVLLFDQFEQFFKHFPSEEQRLPLFTLLANWYQHGMNLPVKILLCYRDDLYAQHVDLQKAIGSSLPARDILYLKKFTPEQATEIFAVLAEAEQLQCKKADILKIAQRDLAKKLGERISPVDIQIVSWMIAKQKESGQAEFNEDYYLKIGGIEGLLENYLADSLKRVPTESQRQLYFKVLLALIDENVRAGVLTLAEIQEKLKGAATAEPVQNAVDWLAHSKTRLIAPVKREDVPGYELAHERLILPIRKLTHKLSTEIEQANMLLDRRTNEWLGNDQDSNYLLRWRELRKISKQQKLLTWGDNEQHKKQLIALSRRRQSWQFSAIGGLLILFLIFLILRPTILSRLDERQRNQRFGELKNQFVPVAGDTFLMGDLWSVSKRSDEKPVHKVILSDFEISKYEITNQQYCDFLNSIDSAEIKVENWLDFSSTACQIRPKDGKFMVLDNSKRNHPVVEVSWYGAAVFCNYLSERFNYAPYYNTDNWSCDTTANGYRLPTEAEWEFAARAGGKEIEYPWGNNPPDSSRANYWIPDKKSDLKPVGMYPKNESGLYDMAGNAWEWCHDLYDANYYYDCYLRKSVKDPKGPSSSPIGVRVLRGGSWSNNEGVLRCSNRSYHDPDNRSNYIGFRIVR